MPIITEQCFEGYDENTFMQLTTGTTTHITFFISSARVSPVTPGWVTPRYDSP